MLSTILWFHYIAKVGVHYVYSLTARDRGFGDMILVNSDSFKKRLGELFCMKSSASISRISFQWFWGRGKYLESLCGFECNYKVYQEKYVYII